LVILIKYLIEIISLKHYNYHLNLIIIKTFFKIDKNIENMRKKVKAASQYLLD